MNILGLFSRNEEINNEKIIKDYFKENFIRGIDCSFEDVEDVEEAVSIVIDEIWPYKSPCNSISPIIKKKNNLNKFDPKINEYKVAIISAMEEVKNERRI